MADAALPFYLAIRTTENQRRDGRVQRREIAALRFPFVIRATETKEIAALPFYLAIRTTENQRRDGRVQRREIAALRFPFVIRATENQIISRPALLLCH